MRSVQKGEMAKAAAIYDSVLDTDPTNRDALVSRATLLLGESQRATSPERRSDAAGKASALMRRYFRTVETPRQSEIDMLGRTLYAEAEAIALMGQYDKAVAVLREAADAGFDAFAAVEQSDSLAALRARPEFTSALEAQKKASLARAA